MLEDRRDSELANRFILLEQVIRALRAEFEEPQTDSGGGLLRCAECGAVSPPDAHGWRAYLAYDPREDEWPEAVIVCPECAEREFGEGLAVFDHDYELYRLPTRILSAAPLLAFRGTGGPVAIEAIRALAQPHARPSRNTHARLAGRNISES